MMFNVGDLVSYAGGREAIGVVLVVKDRSCLVRWQDGTSAYHSKAWILKLKKSEDKKKKYI